MSNIKLKLDDNFYFDQTLIYGLISEISIPRICYFLNQELDLKLARCSRDLNHNYKGLPVFYPQFEWTKEEHDLRWTLTSNKSEVREEISGSELLLTEISSVIPLVPSLKKFDYFLLCEGEVPSNVQRFVQESLQEMNQIRTFEKVDPYSNSQIRVLLNY